MNLEVLGTYVGPLDAVGRWSFIGQYMVSARCEGGCHVSQTMVNRDHLDEELPLLAEEITRAFARIHSAG